MTEVPAAGTAASGRRACACQYSAIWHGAYRGATDGGHGKLHRERRQYLAGGTGGLRYGRAGRAFRPEHSGTYRHEGSRRQYRGSFGTSISFARSASQQLVMDVTRGVLGGGSQYLATKMREVKVVVKANYQLLLISKKQ